MLKFKDALRDFKAAARSAPRDPDLRRKLNECEREVKRLRFQEALAAPVWLPLACNPLLSQHCDQQLRSL